MNFTIINAFKWWAREYPDRIALHVDDDAVSYRDLWDWTGRIGARLAASVRQDIENCASQAI
jgi:fatty-acyl-CoA synthase